MTKEDIEYIKELLTKQLQGLISQADGTVSEMMAQKETYADLADRASLEADQSLVLRIRGRENKLIKKIKKALERIDKNTYGICESCEEEINIERLKARPVTTHCIKCKTKEEAIEKALGR